METVLVSILTVAALFTISFTAFAVTEPASAEEFGTKTEAIAMVKLVQQQFKKDGPQLTFSTVSDKSIKEYHDRDLYPFIYDLNVRHKGEWPRGTAW
jgi:hypothetical protein